MSNSTDEMKVIQIPLNRIDMTDTRYQISRETDISGLALSIRQTGLTRLPLVKVSKESDDCYLLIAGFKRLNALIQNGDKDIVVCQTYPEASETNCAIRAISDNAFQRVLTPSELVKSIFMLTKVMDIPLIAKKSLGIFNTHLSEGYIKNLQKIATLPKQTLKLMDDGQLSIKSAKKLSENGPEVTNCFVSLFSAIKTSSNKQMEIITHFLEIAAREHITPLALYQDIQEILVHDSEDLGFKGNLLRSYLFQRRFPNLEKKRQEIQKQLHSLKLDPGIKLTLPDNFESMNYNISFNFKTLADFISLGNKIDNLSRHTGLGEILKR